MSNISLQFGQCGNQIGTSFYSTLEEDIKLHKIDPQMLNKWFNINRKEQWEPRSILVDTETKVINNITNDYSKFKFKSIVAKPLGGSANNWACGFNNAKHIVPDVLNCIRYEAEKCDFLTSFLSVYSLSGGTGSGVGSCVLEKLHDEYPKKNISCIAVLPCLKAEITIQSYNAILNLSHLYSVIDSMMLFENERLFYLFNYILDQNEVSFQNINKIVCKQLASVHQPINTVDSSRMLNDQTAHTSLKFLTVKSEPQKKASNFRLDNSQAWLNLSKSIMKISRYDLAQRGAKKIDFQPKIVSNTVITRGVDAFPSNCLKYFKEIKDYVRWNHKEEVFKSFHHSSRFLQYDRHMTLISNSSSICIPLEAIVEDAWTSFTHGAYWHHYSKFGLEEDEFLKSFQVLEDILDNYKNV